ncbi:hypothetical protein GU926_18015 [Nibribacter ruber]|uniref:STAS domain-containing protein n=1 Tax=Nibribacter ruber TaxID=2698458 RepID=A0A6P1P4A7_9BACT|nr:STAS domain-containing protein [Nibribacter ruber]QHL89223.1 hypothetical protein GU926_18015 [Nibribacter ruber]
MQRIISQTVNDKKIILLQGDVDTCDQRLSRRLQSVQRQGKECHVWIDCGSVECIRQLGVCHFINQLLVLRNTNPHIVLVQPDPVLQQALAVCKVDGLFTCIPSLEQAYLGV